MSGRNKFILFFGCFALLIGIAVFVIFFKPQEKLKPKRGDVVESIYGLGTVTADRTYHMRSGITLSIRRLFVKEGDLVKVGQPLAQLDQLLMRSPIEGTVTIVSYKEGEIVPPQVSILMVTNLRKLYLEVSLEQQSVLPVKESQKVFVSFESLRDERVEGWVQSIYPRENQFIVRIELKDWPAGVLPGMTADVAILVGKKTDVLLIPLRAISGGQVVHIRNGKKEKVPVKLGVVDGEWGEVISGNISIDDELLIRKK
jgi:multidrug efflux pump subunit AcrA (membrane-fusion protein)